ncbi:SpoIVB peptidase [Mediterraneibacter glycyrrhizinilyticus]|uniref:SpoIVB peptidase n=1 Tax=Mediterraneibacter glycyrrhizinilyticus TaxID=342942 RepID=UPI0025A47EDE|nr:SpoIVB peptidase [Mediterraneibacter glycyrrhizinilyticus]MDM8125321.1 SpoIVB peptidase [Mediterraneibacter glycyrrhizinilyticus]
MALRLNHRKCQKALWAFLFLSGVVVWNQIQTLQEEKALWQTEASTSSAGNDTVLLGGMPVGIYMETDGVLVLNTEEIEGIDGKDYEPAADVVESGDYITAVNHHEISGKADLLSAVGQIDGGDVVLTLRRGEDMLDRTISPVECETGEYKLGIWVRDNVQGLGTITFLTEQSRFGALGHGISDTDTNMLMTIDNGRVYRTSIQDITKGYSGSPGTMEGIIVYNKYNILGTIDKNTEAGIYGSIDKIDDLFDEQIPIETASKEEIEIGDAKIRCYIDNEIKEYDIRVTDIDMTSSEINKGLVIQVTDPELLEKTGGIIQGMSGSPIIQNGKLIGAVTHVFVQDSTMGYGIFIENMLNQVESSDSSKIVSN